MSKLNECHVYGIINTPEFEYDVNSEPISALFTVHTVRRKSGSSGAEEATGTDKILFFTKENEKIKTLLHIAHQIEKLPENTKIPVECYGTLITRRAENEMTCKGCGKGFVTKTYYSYIRPTVINIYGSPLKPGEQMSFLKRMREKSNSITVIGQVASKVFSLEELEENIVTDDPVFSLAVKRNYPLIEDPLGDVDFPLVAARTLEQEMEYIQKNSSLLIRGSIWLKKIIKKDICPNCGFEHEYQDETTLVFPYNVEFLFSSKNRYALGAAIKSFDDDTKIYLTLNGEALSTIKAVSALQKNEYETVRQELYPRVIKKIQPIGENEVIIDLEDDKILDQNEEILSEQPIETPKKKRGRPRKTEVKEDGES